MRTIELMGSTDWNAASKIELMARALIGMSEESIDRIRTMPLIEAVQDATILHDVSRATSYRIAIRRKSGLKVAERKTRLLVQSLCRFVRPWPAGEISKQISTDCNIQSVITTDGEAVIVRERPDLVLKRNANTIDLTRRPSELSLAQAMLETAVGITLIAMPEATVEALQSMIFADVMDARQVYNDICRAARQVAKLFWRYNMDEILEVKNEFIPLVLERINSFPAGKVSKILHGRHTYLIVETEDGKNLTIVKGWGIA